MPRVLRFHYAYPFLEAPSAPATKAAYDLTQTDAIKVIHEPRSEILAALSYLESDEISAFGEFTSSRNLMHLSSTLLPWTVIALCDCFQFYSKQTSL